MTTTYAIDFETYYDRNVSASKMGVRRYLHHPLCDIYLVAVYSSEERFAWVGEPRNFDWNRLDGQELVAHNARFDQACFERLQELGVIPSFIRPRLWHCTADLSVFLGAGRSLKDAARTLLGIDVDKTPREDMKGKTWMEAKLLGIARRLGEYCLHDAWLCYKLWRKCSPKWPEWERRLSRQTREMCTEGVAVDKGLVDEGLRKLGDVTAEALFHIPWARTSPPLSAKALKLECEKEGIPAPASLAEDSEECAAWEEQYGSSYKWVAAMRDFRKANALQKKLETLKAELTDDGVFPYGLKYYGAHTGRWSGDAGFNVQNLPREAYAGVDLRRMIVPRPGHVFVISDLGQIEQRVLSWLAGDERMMEVLRSGVSVYEAHARATMGWTGGSLKHEDPQLYRLAKARVLGLGYGAGRNVFQRIAKTMAGLDVTPYQASATVAAYRRTNPLVVALWNKLDRQFSMASGGDFALDIPSGRSLIYRRVSLTGQSYSAEVQGRRLPFFGGKLAENLTSATARDVLGHALLALEDAGYRVVMHVHDEVVVEVPESDFDDAPKDVERIMTTNPPWLQGLPLTAETFTSPYYTK